MKSPIAQLIEELKCDVHKVDIVMKRAGLNDHQSKLYHKQKEVLCEVLFNLEVNYLNLEVNYYNKMTRHEKA